MASCTQTSKAVSDVQECVDGLVKCFSSVKLPINDDNETFHRLQEKLEFILLLGLKEKPSIFGAKKSFWEYIYSCYNSSKRSHLGIKFVKSCNELKTSIGRGRAFIRFCLMHQSLADSLQTCFIDQKITRDHYIERSLPCQQKLWSPFITSLYNLNEINFDLNQQYSELDTSWPSFARKIFCPSENALNDRNISQNPALDTNHLVEANSILEANVLYLQKKCESLEKEIENNEKKEKNNSYPKVSDDTFLKNSRHLNVAEDLAEENNYYQCSDSFNKYHEFVKNINTELYSKCEDGSKNICDNTNLYFDGSMMNSLPQKLSFDSLTIENPLETVTDSENVNSLASNDKFLLPPFNGADLRKGFSGALPEHLTLPFHCETTSTLGSLFLNTKIVIGKIENSFDSQDTSSIASYLNSLKYSWHAFESCLLSELENFKDLYLQKKFITNYADHIKSLTLKQDAMIDVLVKKLNLSVKRNESLYGRICLLKDKLHSYGLLKIKNECNSSESENPPIEDLNDFNKEEIGMDSCEFAIEGFLEPLETLKSSFSKLHVLNTQVTTMQSLIESSHNLNNDLISRVQDHEMHMKGITKELEEAHHLLSVMRKQHQKLQSAENIVKYDLQEKRKLLNRLKQQLESTREDCNLMWQKNTQSEVEWQSLRKEFVERHKQNSEESGFVDDKLLGDPSSSPSSSTEESSIYVDEMVEDGLVNCEKQLKRVKKSRLDLLEEQCQILCTNLINSSKKHQELDSHLESLCTMIEKPTAQQNTPDEEIIPSDDIYLEVPCVNSDDKSDISPSASPGIESLNSEFCSYDSLESIPVTKDTIYIGSKNPSNAEDIDDSFLVSEDFINSICIPPEEFTEDVKPLSLSCPEFSDHINLHLKNLNYSKQNVSMISNKHMENSFKEELGKPCSSNSKSICLGSESKRISELEEENRILQSKLRELEKENNLYSSKINHHNTIDSAKEHEISALQFQLNSQSLQYEKAIKEYSDNSDELKEMKEKISEQENLILSLEEALTEIQMERENEKELQWEQLEDFKRYSLKDREGMESEISFLQNYSKELQKKVIKLLKQKDVLWRQNDHLTFVQKTQIDDRWMADNEVSECLGCGSNFSFILRKHHCRHCGRIFCYSCSNNWLLTPSSRKQIRVCNDCYLQHMEIKEVVRRNSNPMYYEDESEEEATNNSPSIGNTPFAAESQQTRADSIVSLPVVKINGLQKKSYYASAPNLHLMVNCDSVSRDPDQSIQPTLLCDVKALENSIHGDLIIKSGEEALLPISCQTDSSQLHWSIYPQEAIPIKLVHENITDQSTTVMHSSSCEIQSFICLSLPGLYSFHFDNRSRKTAIIIHYTLKIFSSEKNGAYR